MRQSLPHFTDPHLRFEDLTVPGWTASAENITKFKQDIEDKAKDSTAFVFDLLGNSSLRFEQFDGTTALPFKSNGWFHYGGKVVIAPPDIFKKLVVPVLKEKGTRPCVIVPPLPRRVFSRCCNDENHCSNANEEDYQACLMSGFIKQLNGFIKHLVHSGLKDFKVLDFCCVTSCSPTANIPERLECLRRVTREDGVHFSAEGYRNLAGRAVDCLNSIMAAPRKVCKKQTYFWRGFKSPNGASVYGSQKDFSGRGRGRPLAGPPAVVREAALRVDGEELFIHIKDGKKKKKRVDN
jgi:hypothetical protein